jgi:hypothetical protein
MAGEVSGFPFWELTFDEDGRPGEQGAQDAAVREIRHADLTDLFVFSHGWNNDQGTAERLYRSFFGEIRALVDARAGDRPGGPARIGVVGVFWPSILWPDEEPGEASQGGAAGFGTAAPRAEVPGDLLEAKVFTRPGQQATLAELRTLLRERPRDDAALRRFKEGLRALMAGRPSTGLQEDRLEQAGLAADDEAWREIFEQLEVGEPPDEIEGGAAGSFGDAFGRLWRGAKGALRVASYWQMKARAGAVGRNGLGPLIDRWHADTPNLRIHLVGHSFGARLVSYALAGMSPPAAGEASPVKSLLLLQGAFSQFAFADALPFDAARGGDLRGMAARVDGPLLATHSELDTAVGRAYPLASVVAGDDAAALEALTRRWGAVGHRGAQQVQAEAARLGSVGTGYRFARGRWLNLDANDVIRAGGPPSGAHSDIIHPEIAWAALSAAGILGNRGRS